MKIGKRNGKRKKKRDFPANWAGGGGISAQPSAGAGGGPCWASGGEMSAREREEDWAGIGPAERGGRDFLFLFF
jgi:hypothetical protein